MAKIVRTRVRVLRTVYALFTCIYTLHTFNTYVNAYARIKCLVITPLRGVIPPLRGGKGAGKTKDDRAILKEKAAYQPPKGWYRTP